MYRVLECSSAGEKRLSAFWAVVTIFGVTDTIEHHYQKSKGFYGKISNPKGRIPDFAKINSEEVDRDYLKGFYEYMWVCYLDNHPDLVAMASEYDAFHDKFKGKRAVVCQSDVIRDYIQKGRNYILAKEYVQEFMSRFELKG